MEKVVDPNMVDLDGFGIIRFNDATLPVGLPIINSKLIRNALCGNPQQCVIARSARKVFGKYCVDVFVYRTVMHVVQKIGDEFVSTRYALSGALMKAVAHFDASKKETGTGEWILSDGVYNLLVPSATQKIGGRPPRHNLYGGKGGKKQEGVRVMQSFTRRILGRNANACVAV